MDPIIGMELQSELETIPETTETGLTIIPNAVTSTMHETQTSNLDLFSLRQDASRSLAMHFSRPFRLASLNMASLSTTYFDVLYEFLVTPRNRDRIRGYTYLHGVLHIKATINAPARCSGAAHVALQPWATRDNALGALNGDVTPRLTVTQLSCLPHIFIDLSNEAGGEISMPIITPVNGLDLTIQEQVRSCFRLVVDPIVPAQIDAGDSLAKPILTIFVWMTDVQLTVPTLRLELQSDEYSIHPKDQPSTIKMAMTNMMHKALDGVKGFATDLATTALMAAVGLSKPVNLDPHVQYVARGMGPLSNFNGMDSIHRLSADIKQEVTIDSEHLAYSSGDDMDLLAIAQREAIYSVFNVGTNGTVMPVDIGLRVSPSACWTEAVAASGSTGYSLTPLAFASLPFLKWRGTIKIRFHVVCSAFARGKIKISHDPTYQVGDQDIDFNRLNTVVWDISQSKDCIIHVPWTSNKPFQPVPLLHPAVGTTTEGSNGSLLFSVLTPIIDPGLSNIFIVAYISAGKDMVFADLRPKLSNYTFAGIDKGYVGTPSFARNIKSDDIAEYPFGVDGATDEPELAELANAFLFSQDRFELQSYIENFVGDGAIMTGDVQGSVLEVNIAGIDTTMEDSNNMLACCIGEKFTNLRQIIKRYTHTWTNRFSSSTAESYYTMTLPDKPPLKGWQGTASLNTDPLGILATYARDSYLSYFSTAYLGYRGGFNHKYVMRSVVNGRNAITAQRSSPGYLNGSIGLTTGTSQSAYASDILQFPDTRSGALYHDLTSGNCIEFNTPYCSTGKFLWAQDRTPQVVRATVDRGYDTAWHNVAVHTFNTGVTSYRVDRYIAAGDDFSFFMFLYPPKVTTDNPSRYT